MALKKKDDKISSSETPVVEQQVRSSLTREEMLALELKQTQYKNQRLVLEGIDKEMLNTNLEIELLQAKIAVKTERINTLKVQKEHERNIYNGIKQEYDRLVAEVSKALGIVSSNWGWNPDTGEVVLADSKR